MAFNFNWSPLIADTDRVRDMLTYALNKSPKPPIIVDDIIVNELNLGSTPPELEILEIGDLAEDRFRGIFKMSYAGDAYLTLKTTVQANPLNTYLSTRPSFTSPQPLAASSSLTIPIQITLSDFRLSGFVILVFSKQKGITIVFRNDPLETLKVSSTFDSIPFVRDYLQKTIENQLRVLFVEDLPAIIHRLSLRVFSPEHQAVEEQELKAAEMESQQAVDTFSSNEMLESEGISSDSSASEIYASFSQKSLLRLAALTESQRTLSLFTPSIRDTVYRAWANTAHRYDGNSQVGTPVLRPVSLMKLESTLGAPSALSYAASQTSDGVSLVSRPSLAHMSSTTTVYSMSSGPARPRAHKKRKHRVVNLRKSRGEGGAGGDFSDTMSIASSYDESASRSLTGSAESSNARHKAASSTHPTTAASRGPHEGEISTPPPSARKPAATAAAGPPRDSKAGSVASGKQPLRPSPRPTTPTRSLHAPAAPIDLDPTPRASVILPAAAATHPDEAPAEHPPRRPAVNQLRRMQPFPSRSPSPELRRSSSDTSAGSSTTDRRLQGLLAMLSDAAAGPGSNGGILEQAWMQKMAGEIARKVAEEKARQPSWSSIASAANAGTGAYSPHHHQPPPQQQQQQASAGAANAADEGMEAPPPAYGS